VTFDFQGYELKFVQRSRCKDDSAHLYTYIYKFFSPVTRYYYVVRAEYHEENVFAIKFYCKKDKRSDYKYSKIINKGDLGNIIMSCAKVIPLLLRDYPQASFCFAASRSVDPKNNTIEDYRHTQRFQLYCYMIPMKFGVVTFEHHAYDDISCYLLRNRHALSSRKEMETMFQDVYVDLSEVNL
jgi:hypothetical protein